MKYGETKWFGFVFEKYACQRIYYKHTEKKPVRVNTVLSPHSWLVIHDVKVFYYKWLAYPVS